MVRGSPVAAILAGVALASCSGSPATVVVEACVTPATACYSNADCSDPSQSCAVPANADPTIAITCCLPGPRGTGQAGDPCTGLSGCQSAVCAYTPMGPRCSAACTTDVGCPAVLPSCVSVDAGVSFCGLPP